MGTLFDYVKWRGDLSFLQAPFNEVDSLILSLISYVDFEGIVPAEHDGTPVLLRAAANAFFARNSNVKKLSIGLIVPKDIIKLLRAIKDTRRFRGVSMRGYVNMIDVEKEMQFSAVTFFPKDGSMVVAYRGTDDTIVGWKEDFKMCFLPIVPAQAQAVLYLDRAAGVNPELSIRLTGHSKGGNLAVYAAVNCERAARERLINVWSNDGPGFNRNIMEDEDFLALRPIIRSLVPENAVIGMLLEHDENYVVVKSKQKGLYQHDGLSWEVQGPGFVYVKDVTNESKRRDRVLKEWVREMSNEQREQFVEALFQVLSSNGKMLTLTDVVSLKNRSHSKSKEMDPHVYKTLQKTFAALISLNAKTILSDVFPNKKTDRKE